MLIAYRHPRSITRPAAKVLIVLGSQAGDFKGQSARREPFRRMVCLQGKTVSLSRWFARNRATQTMPAIFLS
jgi:hypothetical protein